MINEESVSGAHLPRMFEKVSRPLKFPRVYVGLTGMFQMLIQKYKSLWEWTCPLPPLFRQDSENMEYGRRDETPMRQIHSIFCRPGP